MNNQELMQKMKEDMEMLGFSPHTKDSYERNVNGKKICRKMAKKNVVFPTYFFTILK